ncbi:MAG: FHA domain-containing protein [Deltaproteobacteria bacterium]|nr:FHA domain-containing protein [Deltaproteobacteria bacterium]
MVKLIIEDDEGKTTVVPLNRDEVTVGRKEGNTIRLTERNVSRRHARILRHNGTVFVEDLGSYNGVKVNGNRIAGRVAVAEGDRIQIGDYLLGIKVDRTTEMPADPFADQKTTPMPLPPPVPGDATVPTTLPEAAAAGAAAAPVAEAKPLGPAKLVVISQNFFGLVFPLDKAAVVIGRTEENDIIINHRSVSRHHAKIVREKTRYTVVDLQSANGVRVNGEEYGKVELRRGDLIDLGHVRMRFVDPDEDFVPDRDATALVPMPGEKRGKGLILGVLLVVGILGGVLFAVRGKLFGPKEQPVAAAQADAGTVAVAGPTGLPAPTAATGVAPTGAPTVDLSARLGDGDRLMKDERWGEAIKLLSEVLAKDPSQELARDKRAKATAEQKNQDALTTLSESVDKKDADKAFDAFKKIPDDSVYKKRADDLWTRVKPGYVQRHLAAAKRLKDDGRCDAMKRELALVEAQDAAPGDLAKLRKDCKEAVVLGPPTKGPKEPKEPKRPPEEKAPAAAKEMDDGKAKDLVDQAAAAFARGQNAQAITLASQATKLTKKPGLLNRANATMALGHCSSGRKDAAQRLANRLDGAWKGQVKSLCRSKGIELD